MRCCRDPSEFPIGRSARLSGGRRSTEASARAGRQSWLNSRSNRGNSRTLTPDTRGSTDFRERGKSMSATTLETDVLIVGGPVGLFLANECARRGLRYRIVEARATQSEHSEGSGHLPANPGNLRHGGHSQTIPRKKQTGSPPSPSALTDEHSHGCTSHREESPYAFVAMVPQDVTERFAGGGASAFS